MLNTLAIFLAPSSLLYHRTPFQTFYFRNFTFFERKIIQNMGKREKRVEPKFVKLYMHQIFMIIVVTRQRHNIFLPVEIFFRLLRFRLWRSMFYIPVSSIFCLAITKNYRKQLKTGKSGVGWVRLVALSPEN